MKGGGWNAENSQASDGRRVADRKCRDCDSVAHSRDLLCTACKQRAFERRKQFARLWRDVRRQPESRQDSPIENLSLGLAGLQQSWFTTINGSASA